MIFILYGENEVAINEYIDTLIKENNIETIVKYNYKESNIEDVIEEAGYLDLFGNKKLIILNDCDFLTSKSTLENETFDNYINSPNNSTFLILKIITDKLDERKKILKTLKNISTIKEFTLPNEKNIDIYIQNYFKKENFNISNDAIKEIAKRLTPNPKVLNNELEKLKLYKIQDKNIELKDVINVITKYEENNIFKLVDAVVKKDKKEIFNLYKKLINDKEEPTVILVLLANQFRLMYSVKVLTRRGLNKTSIATELKEHPYRVELAITNSQNIKEEELINYLKILSDIDIQIKTGKIDKIKALELFFLEL